MARTTGAPLTPAKTSRRNSSLQNSPFSDYFSDDARSSLNINPHAPSTETKALLVKMNKLQSQLMRDQSEKGREAIKIVGRKLAEIDLELDTLHSQTQQPIDMDNARVLMAEEKEKGKAAAQTPQHSRGSSSQSYASLDSSVESSRIFDEDSSALKQYQAERTWYMSQMQDLLEKLNTVQSELRQRQSEFAELHERHYTAMEEKEEEIEQLRSENEGLRQDLGFEYSELLFLKLQMKSLEVDVDDLRYDGGHATGPTCSKKNAILSEMDRWRTDSDWQDVEARFKRRRSKYGIPTSPISKGKTLAKSAETQIEDEADWQLETIRECRGRITSLTIKRTDSSQSVTPCSSAEGKVEQIAEPVTLAGSTGWPDSETTTPRKNDASTFFQPPCADRGTQTHLLTHPTLGEDRIHFEIIPMEGDDQEYDEEDDVAKLEELEEEEEEEEEEDEEELEEEEDEEEEEEETEEEEEEEEEQEEEGEEGQEEDGAQHDSALATISSASIDDDDQDLYQDVEEDDETILEQPTLLSVPQHKSAWQELWSSLQSLTGIPDEDDDDDADDDDY